MGNALALCLADWISTWIITLLSHENCTLVFSLAAGESLKHEGTGSFSAIYTHRLPFLRSKNCCGLMPRMLTCEEQPPSAFHGPKMNHVTFIPQIRHQVRAYCFWTTAIMWFTERRIGTIQSSEYVTKLEGISKHRNMQHFRGNIIKRGIRPIDHCLCSTVISKNNLSFHFWERERKV